jgi:hypothetical protein
LEEMGENSNKEINCETKKEDEKTENIQENHLEIKKMKAKKLFLVFNDAFSMT